MYKELKPGKTYAYIMAGVLTVNILLCFALYGLFLLILIGAWHVIDALVFVFTGDRRRMPYLYALAAYAWQCISVC